MFYNNNVNDTRARALRFLGRVYRMRMLGAVLCVLPISSVLSENHVTTPLIYAALIVNGFIWPHVAYYLSSIAADPVKREFNNLIIDSALGGFWIAVMGVSPIPTAVFITLLTIDKIASGGWPLLQRATLALCVSTVISWTLLGFPLYPALTMQTLFATMPFLLVYTVVLSYMSYRQARKIAHQNKELERLNRTDTNIELPNRRFFEQRIAEALEHYHSTGQVYSLLLIDIDHFKEINDNYGHNKGDEVLTEVANILRTACRAHDTPARYGGDEFAVLLTHTDVHRAAVIGERIRQKVGDLMFHSTPGLVCSTSIGVTQVTTQFTTPAQWVTATDAALYRAKAAGRNQVACEPPARSRIAHSIP
jgi:diguanylate cyclase